MPRIDRREFLRLSAFTVAVSAAPQVACGTDDEKKPSTPEEVDAVFPQGLASGDPGPDKIVLWTRVAPQAGHEHDDGGVELEVALDEAFSNKLQLTGDPIFPVFAGRDHAVKIVLNNLSAYTTYYYRFTARGVTSMVGRTRTAPATDQDVNVKLAFASCQDFIGRYYHSWSAIADEDLDLVVFLGDYVYETTGDPGFQETGSPRKVVLPDGIDLGAGNKAALSLADYRTLYKTYRSDPVLKNIHARFPFVTIWDDHEFSDDCWGDHGTYFDEAKGDEADADRRHAASQAWFEYQPADVNWDQNGEFPNDIRIYRNVRYGKNLELFLLDDRYYRDDHVIPEGPKVDELPYKAENSAIGSRQFMLKSFFDGKEAEAKPTLLGSAQKAWLIDGVKASNATWRVIGSQVQMAQMTVDLTEYLEVGFPSLAGNYYFSVDQWDGYRSERAEILSAFRDAGVKDLVVFAGDVHAFYAAELRVNPDDNGEEPVAVEFTVAGISSEPVQNSVESAIRNDATLEQIGLLDLVPRFDEFLLTPPNDTATPYKFANSNANGICVAEIKAEEVAVRYLQFDSADLLKPEPAKVPTVTTWKVAAGASRLLET